MNIKDMDIQALKEYKDRLAVSKTINKESILQLLQELPFADRDSGIELDLCERFSKLRDALNSNEINSEHLTGVWYISGLKNSDTNAPQLLTRTVFDATSIEALEIVRKVFHYVREDMCYDFDLELMQESDMREYLITEMRKGNVYTIYDMNRKKAHI